MAFTFDVTAFRVAYPAFANATTYPDALLTAYWTTSGSYINTDNYGALVDANRNLALNLMTAHLTMISVLAAADLANPGGKAPGLVQSATIDKITVSLTPPKLANQFQWWLSLTPYGQQLLVLLQVNSAGGWYVGGLPERSAFRKVGGLF